MRSKVIVLESSERCSVNLEGLDIEKVEDDSGKSK